MADPQRHINRIPHESLSKSSSVSRWAIPPMNCSGNIIRNAKNNEIERERERSGREIIEDYKGIAKSRPLTAEEMQRMVKDAQQEGFNEGIEEGTKKGMEEGLAKGLIEGKEKAYQSTKAILNEECARFAEVTASLMQPMLNQQEALENIVVDMAVQFAKELIQQEITQSPLVLYKIVNRALTSLPAGSKNIQIYLNEQDVELIKEHFPEEVREWSIGIDPNLARGGCRVESQNSLLDYSVEKRLADFREEVVYKGEVETQRVSEVVSYREEPQVADNGSKLTPSKACGTDEQDGLQTSN